MRVDGRDLTHLPAHRRNVGIVFQSYALFPHLDVHDNIAFGLRAKGMASALVEREVREALALVRLEELGGRSVRALSGGQQQRVSLARAMVTKPAVMLLDEPFSALDRKLRETMQIETRQILRRIGATAIFVTHDQEEALVMSDRVVVMNQGRAEQIGAPKSVYAAPATPFVLDFVGQSTRLRGTVESVEGGLLRVRTEKGMVSVPGSFAAGTRVLVAVRPEAVRIHEGSGNTLKAIVRDVVFLGSKTHVVFDSAEEDILMAELPGAPPEHLRPGGEAAVSWPVEATLLYRLE